MKKMNIKTAITTTIMASICAGFMGCGDMNTSSDMVEMDSDIISTMECTVNCSRTVVNHGVAGALIKPIPKKQNGRIVINNN